MKDVVLITGGNGSLAGVLYKYLSSDYQVRYLTTNKKTVDNKLYFYWNIKKNKLDENALKNCTHIIHLAGFPIIKRWTRKNKKLMYESRVFSTNMLFEKCKLLNIKPKTFICASAIGIYNKIVNEDVTENSKKGNDWLAKLAIDWEEAASQFKEIKSRVVQMRISLIFDENSGFLKYNLLSMKYGIGVVIGNGNNKISWIHIEDVKNFILEAIKNKNYNGAYNLASENPISQNQFISSIKKIIYPNSIIIKIPEFFIKTLLGEKATIIKNDICINVNKLKKQGFIWKFNNFQKMIKN